LTKTQIKILPWHQVP